MWGRLPACGGLSGHPVPENVDYPPHDSSVMPKRKGPGDGYGRTRNRFSAAPRPALGRYLPPAWWASRNWSEGSPRRP